MLRTLILEDSHVAAESFKRLLQETVDDIEVVIYDNEDAAYEFALGNPVDLFVIDINLEDGGSGYSFVERIRKIEAYELTFVVFITSIVNKKTLAYDNLHCYEYLIKPIDEGAFKKSISKILKYDVIAREDDDYIVLKGNSSLFKIRRREIMWVDVKNKLTNIYINTPKFDGKPTYTFTAYSYPLRNLEGILGEGFIRMHKSTIVSKQFIGSMNFRKEEIELSNSETVLKMGKKFIPELKKIWRVEK